MSKMRATFYVSACTSDHVCAYIGQATHACIEASLVPRPFLFLCAHAKHKREEKFEFFLALVFRVYQVHVKMGKAWEQGYNEAIYIHVGPIVRY